MLKKILIGAAAALTFCVFHSINNMNVEAMDSIKVDDSDKITLISDHAASDEIAALQLSLNVETDPDAEIYFEFDSENQAKISEYRYNEDSECLNIYLSDNISLFDGKEELDIGIVCAKNAEGENVDVKVNTSESSLKYVYNNSLVESRELTAGTEPVTTDPSIEPTTAAVVTTVNLPAETTEKLSEETTVSTTVNLSAEATEKIESSATATDASNPETTSTVTTAVKKHIASDKDLCSWAIKDYYDKTGVNAVKAEINPNSEEQYEIVLYDDAGNVLDTYTIDPETGIGVNSNNEEVNLPQTGNNSITSILIVLGALALIAAGIYTAKKSGVICREEDEK